MVTQLKIFKSVDTDLEELERQMNRWIRKTGVKVISVTSNLSAQPVPSNGAMNSFAASDVMFTILYEVEPPKK